MNQALCGPSHSVEEVEEEGRERPLVVGRGLGPELWGL